MQPAITSMADAIPVVISEFAYRESGGYYAPPAKRRIDRAFVPAFDYDLSNARESNDAMTQNDARKG